MELMQDPVRLTPEACKGVLVFAEQRGGKLVNVSLELLNIGRTLANQLGAPLCAALLGQGVADLAGELQHYQVDEVHVVDSAELAHFQDESYAAALTAVIQTLKPSIVLAGMTNVGRSFLPRVAAQLGVGLTSGCTALSLDGQTLVATRPAFGGTVYADVVCEKACPQMATVRRKVYEPAPHQAASGGTVVNHTVALSAPKAKFLENVNELAGALDLTEADVIVSGGRGIGGPEFFESIKELAKVLGGAVGASRATVDAGWIDYSHQVGQTGKSVKPKIYFACGISGAIQHLVGMRNSDTIIAINRDPEAPIFNVATYGLVGDVKQIVPALIKRFSQGN
jgi:electron transfer flavoprotein alpha subunit